MDAANIFKPALARGELQVIGATTFAEHRKTIEKDGALERRFQEVVVNEPSIDDSILILNGLKEAYETHHKVKFTPEALAAAVRLSERYMTTRQLPDKAIDVIDETGSRVRIQKRTPPKEIAEIKRTLSDLELQKEAAIIDMKFEEAAKVQDEIERLELRSVELTTQFHIDREEDAVVDETAIIEVVSKMTGIPITKADDDEIESLLRLEDDLRLRVIGQEDALEAVAKSIRRARTGIHNPKKPMGTFMFLGPTGVGKTELAKAISELVFKSPDALVRIDMSEYMDKFNVSRLIGAAPGFVGHEEGGQLTEAVRKRPYSVVLFDEIEKAHPDVFNILLQILDDGHITDSLGRKINFKNTIIIMTSNVGSRNLSRGSLGFSGSESKHDDSKIKIEQEMKKVFNPEFINRLDDAISFHSLRHEDIVKIVDIQIGELSKRLSEQDVSITITDDAKAHLAQKSYDPAMGARPLRRNIQKLVEDNIAENFLRKIYVRGSTVNIGFDADKNTLTFA
jgi:ATP-dependent Clp protease ATP-binding subunit ClpC